MSWLALDIGGANLKAADGLGYAATTPFALWREPQRLAETLRQVIANAPACDHLAVTMTGELCDCFDSKSQGVLHILDAVDRAADGRTVSIYQTNGQLWSSSEARDSPLLAAASNWHALARFAARFAGDETGLLIDIGSTTTDVVPLAGGSPANRGKNDTERLLCGELIYTGVKRSPVCAILGYLPYRGQLCAVAQEHFATAWDAYLMLNELPDEPDNKDTADGRAATRSMARARLARCVCADPAAFVESDAVLAAESIRRQQSAKIAVGLGNVLATFARPITYCVISGCGEFLARHVLIHIKMPLKIISLSEELGAHVSGCAPAHALAALAREGGEA